MKESSGSSYTFMPTSIKAITGSFTVREVDGHLLFEVGCEKLIAHTKEEFLSRAFSLLQKHFAIALDDFEKRRLPHIHSAKE